MGSLRSRRVVVGGEVRPLSVRWEEGRIVDLGDFLADLDLGDLMVMPGLVDSHVHVNEPGRDHWEGFETATTAAAAGGNTTIVDMPLNSIPPTVDRESLEAKRRAAEGKLSVDVAFWGGLVPGRRPLHSLVDEGICGLKCFLVDSGVEEFPPVTLAQLEEALGETRRLGVPVLVHAEDPARIAPLEEGCRDYARYMASRPADAEAAAVAAVSRLCAETGAPVHVVHVSSSQATELVGSGPDALTAETCPHYLLFDASAIAPGETVYKCAPPIRTREHREALWEGLQAGWLDMVVSDHSPSPPELKTADRGDFATAWGGIGSLQLRLPATWTGAAARHIEPERLANWLAAAPARLAGLEDRKGNIGLGMDADLVVWDPDGVTEVSEDRLLHRHRLTPYLGMSLRGSVEMTILRGEPVYAGGVVRRGGGRMLRRS